MSNWNRNYTSATISHFSGVDVIGANAETSNGVRLGRTDRLRLRHLIANRDCSVDRHPGTAAVSEKVQRRLRAHFYLPHHVRKNFPRLVGGFFSAEPKHGDG